jgi:hypothetical protein
MFGLVSEFDLSARERWPVAHMRAVAPRTDRIVSLTPTTTEVR